MIDKMKVIQFQQTGLWTNVLKVSELPIDEPESDEVQIRILARPVNPSDEMFIQGVYRQKPVLPQIAGLEGAGIIEKCGQEIDQSFVGKHVCFRARGTWAEKVNLKFNNCNILPDQIPFEVACQLSLNTLTAYALLERAELSKGQWLLLTAANSSVGQQLIQIAKAQGIHVVAIIRKDEQRQKLHALGATLVLNSEKQDVVKEISEKVENGVHACMDAVGGTIGSQLFKVAALHCKMIIYGRLSNEPACFLNADVVYKNIQLQGFGIDNWMNSKTKDQLSLIWNSLIISVSNGTLKVNYDKIFQLSDFQQAIQTYKETGSRIILK